MTQERKKYEILTDEFMKLDEECTQLIGRFADGSIIYAIAPQEGAATAAEFMEKQVLNFNAWREHLTALIESRNAKLQELQLALRQEVMLKPGEKRGMEGKAAIRMSGPFFVSSRTKRSFDMLKLFPEIQKLGLADRLAEVTSVDKETGLPTPAVRMEWTVDFEPVKYFLLERNLGHLLDLSYIEVESTPAVRGPKAISMFGVDKSGGKGES